MIKAYFDATIGEAQPQVCSVPPRNFSRNTMSEKPNRGSAFKAYFETTSPPDAKRTRSSVIRKKLAQKIINYLKGTDIGDKEFHHFIKNNGFKLLDLPSLGIREALVIKLKQAKLVCVCVETKFQV